jgi:tellurite methyltransferase
MLYCHEAACLLKQKKGSMKEELRQEFGEIDIYLFDQLLKGRFDHCQTILDAGCGSGRNLTYFLRHNYTVFGLDTSAAAIAEVQELAARLAPGLPASNFRIGFIQDMPFPEASFDLVIASAVLHFARNQQDFDTMLRALWRVLKPGGYLFARLASSIGLENLIQPVGDGRYYLPDGSERFLVDEPTLLRYTRELNGELFEYVKTTNVQNLRCMTTWCLQKKEL